MKVCIVTLYKTTNSGSYWQAKTLGMAIEAMGYSVCYYDVQYLKKNVLRKYYKAVKLILKGHFSAAGRYIRSIREFSTVQKELTHMGKAADADCFVLGSDTIWNLESENLRRNIPVFWGTKFKNYPVITYAGSVGSADKELFSARPKLQEAVAQWRAISVRDQYSNEIISGMTEKEIVKVCDPTFLVTRDQYEKMVTRPGGRPYIFLYLFQPLSDKQQEEVIGFAKKKNLRIVKGLASVAMKHVDETIVNSPGAFLNYMAGADYVITDTFHGTAFSISLGRQFVTIDRGKNKVRELLTEMQLNDRTVSPKEPVTEKLQSMIDYQKVSCLQKESREHSFAFLKEALEKCDQ